MNTGIYVIRNIFTGEEYVGSAAKSFKSRWNRHILSLSRGTHYNWFMQAAWNFFGPNVFSMNIMELCPKEILYKKEQRWMSLLKPEYNICKWAGCPNSGRPKSSDFKKNKSIANTGIGNPFYGKSHTEETKAIISKTNKGRVHSLETREKVRQSLFGNKRTLGMTWHFGPDRKRIYSRKETPCLPSL